jgi:hypothetical protein
MIVVKRTAMTPATADHAKETQLITFFCPDL